MDCHSMAVTCTTKARWKKNMKMFPNAVTISVISVELCTVILSLIRGHIDATIFINPQSATPYQLIGNKKYPAYQLSRYGTPQENLRKIRNFNLLLFIPWMLSSIFFETCHFCHFLFPASYSTIVKTVFTICKFFLPYKLTADSYFHYLICIVQYIPAVTLGVLLLFTTTIKVANFFLPPRINLRNLTIQ